MGKPHHCVYRNQLKQLYYYSTEQSLSLVNKLWEGKLSRQIMNMTSNWEWFYKQIEQDVQYKRSQGLPVQRMLDEKFLF